MTNFKSHVSRMFATLLWLTFAASIILHLWIGGVVVNQMQDDGQYYFLLRENRDLWVPTSQTAYVAHSAVRAAMVWVCSFALCWFLGRWLWEDDVDDTPSNRSLASRHTD